MTWPNVRPLADSDTDEAADYLAREANVDVARRFLAALDQAYARLCEYPLAGAQVQVLDPKLRGLRLWRVPSFERYLIFYLPAPGRIDVVRILHGSRELASLLGIEEE